MSTLTLSLPWILWTSEINCKSCYFGKAIKVIFPDWINIQVLLFTHLGKFWFLLLLRKSDCQNMFYYILIVKLYSTPSYILGQASNFIGTTSDVLLSAVNEKTCAFQLQLSTGWHMYFKQLALPQTLQYKFIYTTHFKVLNTLTIYFKHAMYTLQKWNQENQSAALGSSSDQHL